MTLLAPMLPINPLNPITGLFGDATAAATSAILDGLSHWIASGTASLIGSLAAVLDHVTSPDLGAAWFGGQYQAMFFIALLLALPLLFATAITSVVHQDAGPIVRAVFVGLPLAGVGTGVGISLTTLALSATDALCSTVSSGVGADTHALFDQLANTLNAGVPGAGGFGVLLVALFLALGAFLLTLELIVRSAAVYVAMLFFPLALAGMVWPATARWGRRLAETLAALILSKFVMVAVISLAVAALTGGFAGQGLSGLLTGAALLLLATVAPFALLRMAPVIEAGAIAHLEGAGRRAASAPGQVQDAAAEAHANVARVLDRVRPEPPVGQSVDPSGDIGVTEGRVPVGPDGTQMGVKAAPPAFAASQPGAGAELGVASEGAGAAAPVLVAASAGKSAAVGVLNRVQDAASDVGNASGGE